METQQCVLLFIYMSLSTVYHNNIESIPMMTTMRFFCVVERHVALSNIRLLIVAMEKKQWVSNSTLF
jgi:hypothetical protein